MKKKYIFIVLPILVFLVAFLGVFLYFNNQNKKTNFTLKEKQWIEDHKSSKIDFDIVNNYPVYGMDGTGVFFNYINNLENTTGLAFNKVPLLDTEKTSSDYSIHILNNDEELGKNDLLLFTDSYVAISTSPMTIAKKSDINNLKVGVLDDDMSEVGYYLKSSANLTYVSYDDVSSLYKGLDNTKVDMIVVPYMQYLEKII